MTKSDFFTTVTLSAAIVMIVGSIALIAGAILSEVSHPPRDPFCVEEYGEGSTADVLGNQRVCVTSEGEFRQMPEGGR